MIATLLSLALLGSPAQASSWAQRGPDDDEVVTHPLGELRKWTLRGLCDSDYVFVGTISQSSSYWHTFVDPANGAQHQNIVSDILFTVDTQLHGTLPSGGVQMTVDGGTVGDTTATPDARMINPVVGYRYAVGFNLVSTPSGSHPVIHALAWVDPDAELPANLQSEFDAASAQYCGSL